MKINFIISPVVLFYLLPATATPQQKKATFKPLNPSIIIIEGCIRPVPLQDTVFLSLKREFIYNNIGAENYNVFSDSNGYFRIVFRNILHPAKLNFNLTDHNLMVVKDFYVEAGDSIFISFTKNENNISVTYSGKGFKKFDCMSALDSTEKAMYNKPMDIQEVITQDPVNKLAKIFKWYDSIEHTMLQVLSTYKDKVSPVMYDILKSEVVGRIHKNMCLILTPPLQDANSLQKEEFHSLFNDVVDEKEINKNYVSGYSEEFIEFLFRRCVKKLSFASNDGKYSMKDVVALTVKEYKGFIRERILVSYLMRDHFGISNEEYEYCLVEAVKAVQSVMYKRILKQQLQRLEKGSLAYNFSLPDSSGKNISLDQFRGKVVFIDFWFTGCYSCVQFSEMLEKNVIDKYSDSSVVFISICIDKEKSKWLTSLQSGQYSAKKSVNIYTAGLGMDHPLIKYYNIQGCPYLLMVDKKGKVYAAKPPRDPGQLCRLINDALQ